MFERIDTDRDGVLREDDWNAELHRARVITNTSLTHAYISIFLLTQS